MFVRTSMDSESHDATKITYALQDPRIYASMKLLTLDMCFVAITIFLSDSLFSQCCGTVDIRTRWCVQNQSVDEKFC